jgi:hypothetical protein
MRIWLKSKCFTTEGYRLLEVSQVSCALILSLEFKGKIVE